MKSRKIGGHVLKIVMVGLLMLLLLPTGFKNIIEKLKKNCGGNQ